MMLAMVMVAETFSMLVMLTIVILTVFVTEPTTIASFVTVVVIIVDICIVIISTSVGRISVAVVMNDLAHDHYCHSLSSPPSQLSHDLGKHRHARSLHDSHRHRRISVVQV